MKALKLSFALLFLLGGVTLESRSQSNVYSLNIIGYINRPIRPGDNLIANQLNFYPPVGPINNSINNILAGVADGTTFTKWDASANAFLPLSVFDLSSQTWSINYSLNLGEGALVNSSSLITNTFVGQVGPYFNEGSPRLVGWSPGYADGLHLISCPIPFGNATFGEVVGRAPQAGEWVKILNEQTQTYSTTTFDGSGWDNGAPTLPLAQAAWFNLGPVNVPEPSSMALAGVAFGALLVARRRC